MPLICGFISDGYQSTIEGLYNIARNGDKQETFNVDRDGDA